MQIRSSLCSEILDYCCGFFIRSDAISMKQMTAAGLYLTIFAVPKASLGITP